VVPWVFGRHGPFDTVPPLQAAPVISTLPFMAYALARQGDLTASIYTDGVRLINADNTILWHDSDFKPEGDAKLLFHRDGFIVASARPGIAAWNRDGMKLWEIERSAMSDRDGDGGVTALASAADGTIYATGGQLRAIDKSGNIPMTARSGRDTIGKGILLGLGLQILQIPSWYSTLRSGLEGFSPCSAFSISGPHNSSTWYRRFSCTPVDTSGRW
jgi:hypothetical protein